MATIIDFEAVKLTDDERADFYRLYDQCAEAARGMTALAGRVTARLPEPVRDFVTDYAKHSAGTRAELLAEEPDDPAVGGWDYDLDLLIPLTDASAFAEALAQVDPDADLYESSPESGEDDDEAPSDPA